MSFYKIVPCIFFSMNKLKHMSHIVNNAISTLVNIMEEKVGKGEEFDIFHMFQGLTCDVIGECALAMKVNLRYLLVFNCFF